MSRDYDFTAEAEGCNYRSGLKIQIVKLKYLELIVHSKKKKEKQSKNHVYKLVVALTVKLLTGRPISLKISKGQSIPLYSNRAHYEWIL